MRVKGRLVAINYRYGTPIIDMWIRGLDGKKRKFTVEDFRPYFYVPDENGVYVSYDGQKLRKITVEEPKQVEKMRENYEKTYEANISYVLRFMIDTDVKCGIEVPDYPVISWKDVKPYDGKLPDLRIVTLDIEVANVGEAITDKYIREAPDAVTCYTIHYKGKYITAVWRQDLDSHYEKKDKNWYVLYHKSERELLQYFVRWMEKIDPDVVVVWNERFDIPYIAARCRKLGVKFNDDSFDCFDAMQAYSNINQAEEFVSLKEAAINEGLIDKSEKELFHKDWWREDLEALITYNKRDVYFTVEINKKCSLLERYEPKKSLAGLPSFRLAYDQKSGIDTWHLRIAKKKGIVLPTYSEKKGRFEGGYVYQPKPGIYRGVSVFDFSKYYPSIILSFKIDPIILSSYYKKYKTFDLESYLSYAEEYVKNGGMTLTLDVVKEALELRAMVDRQIEKAEPGTPEYVRLQNWKLAVKGFVNGIYGVLGYSGFRLCSTELAGSVTALAREGIKAIMERVEELGYQFVYGDTDSVFVLCSIEEAPRLGEDLTEYVNQYFHEKYGVTTDITLKFEKYFEIAFFPGTKKRYCYKCIWEGKECNYIGFKGVEVVRSDYSEFTRQMMRTVFELILNEDFDKLVSLPPKWVREFKEAPLSQICIPKGIDRPIDQYTKLPHHVKGAIYAAQEFGDNPRHGKKVYYIWVKSIEGHPPTDIISFTDPGLFDKYKDAIVVDYDRMISVSIVERLRDIFRVLGLPLELEEGQTTLW